MVHAGPTEADPPAMRTGGLPPSPLGSEWPTCAECDAPQQFLAHLPLPDGPTPAVFMCMDDPGMCAAFVPGSGAPTLSSPWAITSSSSPSSGPPNVLVASSQSCRPSPNGASSRW
jgi:hypothetical protein